MKLKILATSILLLLTACASGPQERMLVQKEVPQLPALPPPTPACPFLGRMENFLQGRLPEPNSICKKETSIMNDMKQREKN